MDNIDEKKKQLRIKSKTISTVLDNFERQMSKMNINTIKYEFDKNV